MKGMNKLVLNEATMIEAMQLSWCSRRSPPMRADRCPCGKPTIPGWHRCIACERKQHCRDLGWQQVVAEMKKLGLKDDDARC